jgi:uncharacterized protein YacL
MKVLNYFWIRITSIVLILISGFFYIGSLEQYQLLQEDVIINLIYRTLGVWLFGIISSLILLFINRIFSKELKVLSKWFITSLIFCFFSSFIGSLIFFFY